MKKTLVFVMLFPGIWLIGYMLVAMGFQDSQPMAVYRTEAFYDDFNGNQLDNDSWLIAYKQWGGDGANGGVIPENVHVSEGKLLIAARGDQYEGPLRGINRDGSQRPNGKRVGGAIATRDYFASGRFEVRMKVVPSLGAVSAIWTFHYSEYYPGDSAYKRNPVGSPLYYPVNHEIDIEMPGRPNATHTGYNFNYALFTTWVGENEGEYTVNYTDLGFAQNDGQFHVYRFDWHTGSTGELPHVDFYIDDVWQYTIDTNIPARAGRLWIGAWFPRDWAGTPDFDTEYLEVDWVRITPFGESGDEWYPESFPNDGWATFSLVNGDRSKK